MTFDLNGLSLKELTKLQSDIEKAIEEFEVRKRRDALVQLGALAKELGFALNELLNDIPVKKSRAGAGPKYVHPTDPDVTWSGRGRKPLWFVEALAAGKTPEDLAI